MVGKQDCIAQHLGFFFFYIGISGPDTKTTNLRSANCGWLTGQEPTRSLRSATLHKLRYTHAWLAWRHAPQGLSERVSCRRLCQPWQQRAGPPKTPDKSARKDQQHGLYSWNCSWSSQYYHYLAVNVQRQHRTVHTCTNNNSHFYYYLAVSVQRQHRTVPVQIITAISMVLYLTRMGEHITIYKLNKSVHIKS